MARDDCDDCQFAFWAIVIGIGSVVMLIIGFVVMTDFWATQKYESQVCSGATQHLDVDSGGVCAHGTVTTNYGPSTSANWTGVVKLYFPPIEHWLLICKDTEDVKTWAAGLGSAATFECLVENPGDNPAKGISTLFDSIAGWYALWIIALIIVIIYIVGIMFACCEDTMKKICCCC